MGVPFTQIVARLVGPQPMFKRDLLMLGLVPVEAESGACIAWLGSRCSRDMQVWASPESEQYAAGLWCPRGHLPEALQKPDHRGFYQYDAFGDQCVGEPHVGWQAGQPLVGCRSWLFTSRAPLSSM
jgi:hypothetical protein